MAALLAWSGSWLPEPLRKTLQAAFAPICHQRPERTLWLAGNAMCVCSRCAGVYAGIAIGSILAWPALSRRRHSTLLQAAAVLLVADVVTQDLGLHPVWHAARLATGGALGYAASSWLVREATGKTPRGAGSGG